MSVFDGKSALIIEDDATSIRVLQQLLKLLRVETQVITDLGIINKQLAEITSPNVIFLDLEMPQHNGYEILDYLKANDGLQGIPIVAYSTHISHLNNARDAGFHSFLGKPLDGKLFAQQLEDILNDIPVWEVP
ncbi:MAG: response regulator [Chloroflexi bacterium]|nr:response regulator [Chloroflexota bacterium]